MKKFIWMLLAVVMMSDVSGFIINEVMYDPAGNDNNKEFVEVANQEPFNLTGWMVADSEANDTLVELWAYAPSVPNESDELPEQYYALIVEEGFNHTGINASIYSAGATIGNNLNNDHDEIKLFSPNGTRIANMSYNKTANTSLEYTNGTHEESLIPEGTPGRKNSREEKVSENDAPNTTNNTTPAHTVPDPPAEETEENEIINLSAPPSTLSDSVPDPCADHFVIETDKEIIQNKEQLTYRLVLNGSANDSTGATFEYWIEDLYGTVLRKKRTTTSTLPKSFTPSIAEKEKAIVIKATAQTDECVFEAEKLIVVQNPDAQESTTKLITKQKSPKAPEIKKQSQELKNKNRIEYALTGMPENASLANNTATIAFFLDITNDGEDHHFEAWSYVFRGAKSYSGNREENKQELILGAGQDARIPLVNTVNLTPGTYELKIKIRKDFQSSTADWVHEIVFEEPGELTVTEQKKVPEEVKTFISPQSAQTPAARMVQRQSPLPAILGAIAVGVIIVFIWVKT